MTTVTLQEPTGVVSTAPPQAEAIPPATVEVIDGLPCYGEFECEWALDRADQ
jgi:hypothetical protein